MPPNPRPTWHQSLHHNNRLLLSPPHLRVPKACFSARFFPSNTVFPLLVMALRAFAQEGHLNPAYTILLAIKEVYLIHQMSPSLRPRVSGIVASTATITTGNLPRPLKKATHGHIATSRNPLQYLRSLVKPLLESHRRLIPRVLDLHPNCHAL
jgi:hypothetical protein